MSRPAFVIFLEDQRWRCAASDDAPPRFTDLARDQETPEEMAARAVPALKELGYRGQPILLALPTRWCLPVTISLEGLARKHNREPMLYRLEEKLPFAAEDLVADFIRRGKEAMAVAVQLADLRPVVEALESAGVPVQSIAPTSLLALSELQAILDDSDGVLWEADGRCELLIVRGGLLSGWHLLFHKPDDVAILAEGLELALSAERSKSPEPIRLSTFGITESCRPVLTTSAGVSWVDGGNPSLIDAACAGAAAVLKGRQMPLVEFRRDALGLEDRLHQLRRPLIAALLTFTLLLAVLGALSFWRAQKYQRLVDDIAREQDAVFAIACPNQSVPGDVLSRLESEERRLRALRGDTSDVPRQLSALLMLRDALARLPSNLRFRVLELECAQERVYLEGQARSHGDAESIAASLRQGSGWSIDAPRTEQLAGQGVSFTITGKPVAGPGKTANVAQSKEPSLATGSNLHPGQQNAGGLR